DEAIRRADAYAAAGADMVFVEAPETREQLLEIARATDAPKLANMVEGGKTPLHTAAELQDMGFAAVAFANMALRVGAFAIQRALADLLKEGTSNGWLDRMLSWEERQRIAGLPRYLEMARGFAEGARR